MNRRELPLLGGIAGFLHWLEELLIIVSGPLLTLGLGIALVDLLTGVALVVLSGLLRYRPPAAEASAEDERERLARELTLEPMRAQLRSRKALGWRDVAGAITRGSAATGVESPSTHAQDGAGMASAGETEHPSNTTEAPTAPRETPPERPPTGPGSPAGGRGANGRSTRTNRPKVLRLETPPEWKREGRREAAQGRAKGRGGPPPPWRRRTGTAGPERGA